MSKCDEGVAVGDVHVHDFAEFFKFVSQLGFPDIFVDIADEYFASRFGRHDVSMKCEDNQSIQYDAPPQSWGFTHRAPVG